MRVLLIDVNCKQGSTGKIVYNLYKNLNLNGHEASICYGRGPLLKEKNIYKFGIDLETIFHAFMTRITGMTGIYSYFSTQRLLDFIKQFQPDVVHIHELHAYFVNIKPVIEYLKKSNIKTIWTFHCEFMYTGKCGHAFDCPKWKTECGKCPSVHDYPASLIIDFTKKMYLQKKNFMSNFNNLTIAVPSEWLAERVRNSFLHNKNTVVIYNGVDTNVFNLKKASDIKTKLGIPKNNKIILSVAPNIFDDKKGGKYVLDLAGKMQHKDITFIFVGCKKKEIEMNCSIKNIIMLEAIKDQNVLAKLYSMSDLFIICSKKETFSMTCAEALCCGTKVVGFKCGAPEKIFTKPYAQFVDYGNIDALLETIEESLKNPLKKAEIECYGKSHFSELEEFNAYLKCYGNGDKTV